MKHAFLLMSALFMWASPALAAETMDVAIITAPVQRGEIVQAGALSSKTVTVSEARGALGMESIVGQEARRVLTPGTIVRAFDVKVPDMIKKGQTVSMIVKRGALTIAALGRALEDGANGKTIKVQNITSKQIVEGEISGPGQISILSVGVPVLPENI